MTGASTIPEAFVCPITQDVMVDPVSDRDGNSYERAAIEQWIASTGVSPLTRQPMSVADLVPNRALCDAIAEYRRNESAAVANATEPALSVPPSSAPPPSRAPLTLAMKISPDNGETVLSIVPPAAPEKGERIPVDVCCVIDISGSMGDSATIKDEQGKTESHGLSLLDVVKHATRVVGGMLQPGDRLAVVTFTSDAKVVLPLTRMSDNGRKELERVVEAMQPEANTNLWAGLLTGMDLLRAAQSKESERKGQRNAALLLLTDGQPNVEPPRGHLPSLDRYVEQHGGSLAFTVNTFGFGYNLDSGLLNAIARKMGGMYVFIPDSGLVGTVFVNTIANVLCTCATGVTVAIDTGSRAITSADSQLTVTGCSASGAIGSVQFGQSRDVSFALGVAETKLGVEPAFAKVTYRYLGRVYEQTVSCDVASSPSEDVLVKAQCARREFARGVSLLLERRGAGAVSAIAAVVSGCAPPQLCALVAALLKDLEGEVRLASEDEAAFRKWGRHYLPSLVCANVLQQCNNFKDFSVQQYGSDFFHKVRDVGEDIFVKLPPPKASARSRACNAAPVASMHQYYNCRGGCVLAECLVELECGRVVRADAVRRGDVMASGGRVACVVRVALPPGGTPLVRFSSGLVITEFHPVRVGGVWQFPVDVCGVERIDSEAVGAPRFVFTYVLESEHVVKINGVEVVALGHGFTESDVVRHAYLGTQRVVKDLMELPGYEENGFVTVGGFHRSRESMLVCGLVPHVQCSGERPATAVPCA